MKKYKHYIGVDWAQKNMAISRISPGMDKTFTIDVPSSIKELKVYLSNLSGNKVLTIEESSTSQWLYTELKDYVDDLIVCNPHRNRLLQQGPKNDKIDSEKLVTLLKNNLLSPVFHNGSEYFQLRKLVSGYNSIIQNGVRLKNQRAALFVAKGKNIRGKVLNGGHETFVLKSLDTLIKSNEVQVNMYVSQFKKLKNTNKTIKNLTSIPGIQEKSAVRLLSIVIDPRRFRDKGHWLSYCGLVKYKKMSGGKLYGYRKPQYSRDAKYVFKVAAMSCIARGKSDNVFRRYYDFLIKKGTAEHNARHAVTRRIAVIALGVLKSEKPFEDKWNEKEERETEIN